MHRLLALLLLAPLPSRAAPALTGLWLTQDRDGVIAVSTCGNLLCAHIAGVVLDRPSDPMPTDYRGLSQCGLSLVADARQVQPNLWKGHIRDPRNGILFGVELHLDPSGNLALRGFLGIPLLGQTETWTRYAGKPPADCRIVPAQAAAPAPAVAGNDGGSPAQPGPAP